MDGIERLTEHPELGLSRDDLRIGYRQLYIQRHLVFYRLTTTLIRVIRVLGAHMDVDRHL